ncbi:YqiA/YcfP family alpha/beta fold hydrolase [Acinetobacter sp. MD2]|uniref:YqiA/YcfP family alpha/beta fold hydrolase n=1 Tax=Acinetobacter sp. MD2 TaxID=2600066 RepID=UPI002D1F357A|nr:YqiA/YcfP family alpha/beta fold hydrolase [Acinetobacter sp. MD2]MEB3766858.1 esterase [Acinetobacter sp. MD2]
MNILYLHGFQSGAQSIKGLQLQQYCQQHTPHRVYCPDLNLPPKQVIATIEQYFHSLDDVVLVGSSLGGFYATCIALKYDCPAVLINPVIHPWQVFQQRFTEVTLPYQVHENWCLEETHLLELEQLHQAMPLQLTKFLVLLQQGDEVLDYREAQRYYRQGMHGGLVITETGGQHAMCNFADKIPMLLTFLSDRLI